MHEAELVNVRKLVNDAEISEEVARKYLKHRLDDETTSKLRLCILQNSRRGPCTRWRWRLELAKDKDARDLKAMKNAVAFSLRGQHNS